MATLGGVDSQLPNPETQSGRSATIRLTPAFAFALIGAVVAGYVLQRTFVLAHRTLGWAVACAVVALLLEPLVQKLSRVLPRVIAIIGSVVSIVAVAVFVVFQIVRELTASVKTLREVAPLAASRFESRSRIASDLHLADAIKSFTDQLMKDLNQETVSRVRTAPTYVITGVLMLFLLVSGRHYIESGVGQIRDEQRRERFRAGIEIGLTRGRNRLGLFIFQVFVVTIVGLSLFNFLELGASFILALLLGLASLMPYVGLPIGGVPAVVIAYGFHGLGSAIAVGAFVLGLACIDLVWWRPLCDRRTLDVGLFVPLIATLIGYQLYRIGGAVYGYALSVLALALLAATDLDRDENSATWGSNGASNREAMTPP